MKENIKTFPTGRKIWAYHLWKDNFETDLRKNQPLLTCPVCPNSGCPLKKEILGE